LRSGDVHFCTSPTKSVLFQYADHVLVLHALSLIGVTPRAVPDARATPAWEVVRDEVADARSDEALEALEFSFASAYAPLLPELEAYAAVSFTPGRPILAAALDLAHRIFTEFRYEPGSTSLATGIAEAFAMRRGVCQDFAHLGIACLRTLGLPARYVSGYLLTQPAGGRERLVGADASHAWLAVWVPGHGWVDVDPTNDVIPGDEHITVAWGRDYGDVSPVSGVMFGGGAHEVMVSVDVAAVR
jgi:transglutaminase-like putative cysteine protease